MARTDASAPVTAETVNEGLKDALGTRKPSSRNHEQQSSAAAAGLSSRAVPIFKNRPPS